MSQLLGLGFTDAQASELARLATDLGDARKLIAHGCPPRLARRILLPC